MALSKIFWTCFFFLLTILPAAQTLFHFIPEKSTYGVEKGTLLKSPDFDAVWDGTFQRKFENWLSEKMGFRGVLVRTDNQINFSLFREFQSNSRFQVILGKDGYLFERGYISSYVHQKALKLNRLKQLVSSLQELQGLLRKKGKGFLLLVSPSKASVYEEYLPEQYRRRRRPGSTNYDLIMPLLKAAGVNVLDGVVMAKKLKEAGKPAFAKGSTHWTFYTACLVDKALMQEYEKQLGKRFTPMPCEPAPIAAQQRVEDADLASLANLWTESAFEEALPYPTVQIFADSNVVRPSMIAIGSSFMWSILHYLDEYRVYSNRDFYYYFKTKHQYPSGKKTVHSLEGFDWEKEVFSKDLVLIEINQYSIKDLGFGFIESALAELNK